MDQDQIYECHEGHAADLKAEPEASKEGQTALGKDLWWVAEEQEEALGSQEEEGKIGEYQPTFYRRSQRSPTS